MMAVKRETISSVDNAWLRMEDPTNLMMINGVLIFSEPLDFERVIETVKTRLLRFARFRQRVVESRLPLGPTRWVTDRNFDIRAHLHRIALPQPADQAALEEVVSNLMSVPLDYSKPLWQFHVIDNYQGGSVLLGRIHHSIGDGIALMRVLLSLTDDSPEPEVAFAEDSRVSRPTGLAALAGNAGKAWQSAQTVANGSVQTILSRKRRRQAARMGLLGAATLGKLVLRWPDPSSPFKGDLGVIKKAAWSQPLSLQDVKAVGKVTGGTLNDVLLTAMTGALRRYMQVRGQEVDGVNFRALVPVNLRPLDGPIELGNKFGLVFLSLPVGIEEPVERLAELKRRMDALKDSPEAVVTLGLLNVFGLVPNDVEQIALDIFGTKATCVMTNVPGPREPIYLAGSQMDSMMFWVPMSGHLGLGVSIISYAGRVWLGVATDAGLVPDPHRIIVCFHDEFAALMELVHEVAADPEEELPLQPETRRCIGITKAGQQCRLPALAGSDYCHVHQPV